MTTITHVPRTEVRHDFRPRRVQFDYSDTPHHWVPDDPLTTHVGNVMHLLLPAGEKWFCEVFREALRSIDDEDLARDVKAFIGQEATHARAHIVAGDHLNAHGIDPSRYTRLVERGFALIPAGQAPSWLPGPVRRWVSRQILMNQLAATAAIEHFTGVLGWWFLVTRGADEAGADPAMLSLLRWHGAEEVEHRSVAFDTYQGLGGGYLRRAFFMIVAFIGVFAAIGAGTAHLIRLDPQIAPHHRTGLRALRRAGRDGRLPTIGMVVRSVPRYLRPGFHPSEEGSTEVAVAYLEAAIP